MTSTDVLVPTRFLLATGHFVTWILALLNRETNVAAGLPADSSDESRAAASLSVNAAFGLSVACFLVQFYGLVGGRTMFYDRHVSRPSAGTPLHHDLAEGVVGPIARVPLHPAPHRRLNVLHIVADFFGGVLVAWYVADAWSSGSLWWIWAAFNLLPSLLEAAVLVAPKASG